MVLLIKADFTTRILKMQMENFVHHFICNDWSLMLTLSKCELSIVWVMSFNKQVEIKPEKEFHLVNVNELVNNLVIVNG